MPLENNWQQLYYVREKRDQPLLLHPHPSSCRNSAWLPRACDFVNASMHTYFMASFLGFLSLSLFPLYSVPLSRFYPPFLLFSVQTLRYYHLLAIAQVLGACLNIGSAIFSQDRFLLKILKTWTICRPCWSRTR